MLNPVYASTTYLAGVGTEVTKAVRGLTDIGIDGIEVGSTHAPRPWRALAEEIRELWPGDLITHNYFPPAESELIINLASADDGLRAASLAHTLHCLQCAADLGAKIYTVHPGFVADALSQSKPGEKAYDFHFSENHSRRDVAISHMLTSLEQLAAVAAKRGVVLAIETEGSITTPGVLLLETPDEFDHLFAEMGDAVRLNLNLAHSALAARHHGFDLNAFIHRFSNHVAACELSHNDKHHDHHLPILEGSWVLDWLPKLPQNIPLILEFRDATAAAVAESARIVRARLRPRDTRGAVLPQDTHT